MQTQYIPLGQTVQIGDLKPAILLGTNGPSSYSTSIQDPVYPPAQGDYIAFPMSAVTLSGTYRVDFTPTSVGQIRAGSSNLPGLPAIPGWTAIWIVEATGAQVAAGTPLNTEQVQFGALMTQL